MKSFKICIPLFLAAVILMCPLCGYCESAAPAQGAVLSALSDGNNETFITAAELTLGQSGADGVYIVFRRKAAAYTVFSSAGEVRVDNGFLHSLARLPAGCDEQGLRIVFDSETEVSEARAFSGKTPDWAQDWQSNDGDADLLLLSTHSDDEHLFFAGLLPYYAAGRGYRIQVAYFTSNGENHTRDHEVLDGLWKVGVRRYPVFGDFSDTWAENYGEAEKNLKAEGYTYSSAAEYCAGLLRRFRPLVAVGHDLGGEYGHGQHCLSSAALCDAIALAAEEHAGGYPAWQVKKLYLHLYTQNRIHMDWDIPLAAFAGKTAFGVSQDGFACHKSQQWTWFRRWMFGRNGRLARASEITVYSPCDYGLYYSAVGADEMKNDMFENLFDYIPYTRLRGAFSKTRGNTVYSLI